MIWENKSSSNKKQRSYFFTLLASSPPLVHQWVWSVRPQIRSQTCPFCPCTPWILTWWCPEPPGCSLPPLLPTHQLLLSPSSFPTQLPGWSLQSRKGWRHRLLKSPQITSHHSWIETQILHQRLYCSVKSHLCPSMSHTHHCSPTLVVTTLPASHALLQGLCRSLCWNHSSLSPSFQPPSPSPLKWSLLRKAFARYLVWIYFQIFQSTVSYHPVHLLCIAFQNQ